MSQTLAQRKSLAAARAARTDAAVASAVRSGPDTFEPVSFQAMQTAGALLRAGACLVDVRRGRVLLRHDGALCVVDPDGRLERRAAA